MQLLVIAISFPLIIALLLALMVSGSLHATRAYATSAVAVAVEGLLIQVGNGASPEVFTTVANISDVTLPLKAKTVDVTNVSNNWMAEIPTLLQYGKITLKVFWVMEEVTHRNSTSTAVKGMRYLMFNKILADWQFIYPDGNTSTDAFSAYVTGFEISGKVGNVFEATMELSGNDQTPSFV